MGLFRWLKIRRKAKQARFKADVDAEIAARKAEEFRLDVRRSSQRIADYILRKPGDQWRIQTYRREDFRVW